MTNLGAHHLDIVDWYLGLDSLEGVASVGGRYALTDNGETPDTQDVLFDRGRFSAAFVMREAAQGEKAAFGLTFHGTRGTLGIDRRAFTVVADPDLPPANQIPGVKEGHPAGGPTAPPLSGQPRGRTESIPAAAGDGSGQYPGHARDFLDCVKSRKTPVSDLASAHRTAVACHPANLSLRLGRSPKWDWATNRVPGDAEANALLERPYRPPWDKVRA
jgi:predicted dehydrogenase